ncbi:hypothetical protein TTHERM_001122779 (macronuclear) [Tetrahymena thermophila SB210]|uniref:Uncharacterized protein n=1 Tax=Tetrahymena thermophila (strain SB210) TaxID=312017 RepID=W7XIQ5_TETTS|nr:hypothetical protein TTHERM_001122779 [Tetrahymena thermophila SB210]EWS73524.1 hypothetical protein TTHERM_001122779 [Tetrahymena thermophila SB210]|eukprot:XP_012653949.1 hypothetical protein TTHERM_001122779 [Tetrahymena thermophila SB210]
MQLQIDNQLLQFVQDFYQLQQLIYSPQFFDRRTIFFQVVQAKLKYFQKTNISYIQQKQQIFNLFQKICKTKVQLKLEPMQGYQSDHTPKLTTKLRNLNPFQEILGKQRLWKITQFGQSIINQKYVQQMIFQLNLGKQYRQISQQKINRQIYIVQYIIIYLVFNLNDFFTQLCYIF